MFQDSSLNNVINQSSSISGKLKLIAEWNMNTPDNLEKVGNYRYRPFNDITTQYNSLNNSYDPYDIGMFYTNATDSDIALDGVNLKEDVIEIFSEKRDNENLLYSLEDCLGRFRPRSGINKVRYGITKFINHSGIEMAARPRYYMADRKDTFKYWTSYRTESTYLHQYNDGSVRYSVSDKFYDQAIQATISGFNMGSSEYGIANKTINRINYIDDAAPFVVYKEEVPANRIVVKVQTNVGEIDLGSISSASGIGSDPLYASEYRTTPQIWRIQYLKDNVWVDAIRFDQLSMRPDGTPIIPNSGYVEIGYGVTIPEEYSDIFNDMGVIESETLLPQNPNDGDAYLVKKVNGESGIYYVAVDGQFSATNSFIPQFGWSLLDDSTSKNFVVSKPVNPYYHYSSVDGEQFDEFVYMSGIRVVAESMENPDTVLDLIEMSPRLVVDISNNISNFSSTKNLSDLGISGLPVGQLLASVGNIDIFDPEGIFDVNNSSSIIAKTQSKNIQIKAYDSILVNGKYTDVPIKTLYADGQIQTNIKTDNVSLSLRDLFFYFESLRAPEIFVTNVSLSYAITLLLDYVGFTNYVFKRVDGESDPVIPYFYSNTDQNVAEVLNSLAVSFQYAMFFDEYNNLVVMSKDYIFSTSRGIDHVITSDAYVDADGNTVLPNIIDISSVSKDIFTGGELNYSSKYIQKSEASSKQTYMLSKDKTWVYKPSLLWEVSAPPNVRATNEAAGTQAGYSLAAIPLGSDLSDSLPSVSNNEIINNVMDLGEGIYWLAKYSGYLYANGEILKFDAIEYSVSGVSGNVWLSSVEEYQYYFSMLPFNGKMYPTGRVRIFAEPYYDEYDGLTVMRNGAVRKHGRGQFGTTITSHSAGIESEWTKNDNVRGFSMKSQYLFGKEVLDNNITVSVNSLAGGTTPTGKTSVDVAKQSKRSGLMKNYIANFFDSENDFNGSQTINNDMIQSSAFIFEGPEITSEDSPVGFISYVPKHLGSTNYSLTEKDYLDTYYPQDTTGELVAFKDSDNNVQYKVKSNSLYKHFGTRMRVIGKLQNNTDLYQAASGATTYYDTESTSPTVEGLISGGGGGISCLINPVDNTGYYFEIAALDKGSQSTDNYTLDDVFFYKIQADGDNNAVPVWLWSGSAGITVDSGRLAGQSRVFAQDVQTVYDLAVEYEDVGSSRTFYLYVNGTQVATVVDDNPLLAFPNMALFVRGSSKCMFENVYALKANYSKNPSLAIDFNVSDAFAAKDMSVSESFNKYAISGMIQQSFLSGISSNGTSDWNIYYDEFGTIMREVAYFDIKYDKAYPALYSKPVPITNEIKGYTISGYRGKAYGAEFLVFNTTDTTIVLDENSGNFLKIQGIAFTQNTSHKLTVDDYFALTSDFSPSTYSNVASASSQISKEKAFNDIKINRRLYGTKDFSIQADYIQTHDQALDVMSWLSSTIMQPRLSLGIEIFSNPAIQLGDLVSVRHIKNDSDIIIDESKTFIVYSIENSFGQSGASMKLFLSEVG